MMETAPYIGQRVDIDNKDNDSGLVIRNDVLNGQSKVSTDLGQVKTVPWDKLSPEANLAFLKNKE